jgi:hypothetical protein
MVRSCFRHAPNATFSSRIGESHTPPQLLVIHASIYVGRLRLRFNIVIARSPVGIRSGPENRFDLHPGKQAKAAKSSAADRDRSGYRAGKVHADMDSGRVIEILRRQIA